MAIKYTNPAYQHRCYYKKEFPVDVVGKVSNGVVHSYDTLARRGLILAENPHLKMYRVRDVEKGWETWIPFEDVSVGEKYGN